MASLSTYLGWAAARDEVGDRLLERRLPWRGGSPAAAWCWSVAERRLLLQVAGDGVEHELWGSAAPALSKCNTQGQVDSAEMSEQPVADGVSAAGPRPHARLRAGGHLRLSTGPLSPGALTPPGERKGPHTPPAPPSPRGSAAHQEDGRCRPPMSYSKQHCLTRGPSPTAPCRGRERSGPQCPPQHQGDLGPRGRGPRGQEQRRVVRDDAIRLWLVSGDCPGPGRDRAPPPHPLRHADLRR